MSKEMKLFYMLSIALQALILSCTAKKESPELGFKTI